MVKEVVEIIEKINGKIKIKFKKKALCSCCNFTSLCGSEEEVVILDNSGLTLEVGDRIEVGIEEVKSLIINFLTFFLPILIFISLLLFLKKYGELTSFLIAIIVLIIYYSFLRSWVKKRKDSFNLTILRKL
ncbi:MAG: SoxR reducing system RseC family protein [Candidatus Omnitrophica bacterium]|nr:SoxR reducing system RseC family protein [Candidatus Omnitrophota bacterium]